MPQNRFHILKTYTPFLFVFVTVLLNSCLKNDIPYPRIQANFTSFSVDGSFKNALIDSTNLEITVYLEESTDIQKVKVDSFSITPGSRVADANLGAPINLSSPLNVTLSLYQDYAWTISAQQPIERYFSVQNQIGASEIDVPGKRVVAYVPETISLENVKVLSIKLWPEGATVSKNLSGETVNFTHPVEVKTVNHGIEETWTIYVHQTEASVTTVRADAWTNVAWIYGEAQEGKDNGIEYRKASETEWKKAPAEWLTVDGGSFNARLIHLESLTAYVARAYSDDEYGLEIEFTTGVIVQVPNSDFNNWWLNGKVWNPWAEDGTQYWDTGNKGATTLGPSNSVPTDETPTGTGRAAKLETKFVGIGMIGKLAAGNIFTGYYVATDGTNGILSFGREFTERPTKLIGYMKYKSTAISSTTSGYEYLKNRPDTCNIWIALSDKGEPYTIRTNPNNLQLFNPDDPSVIAYGNYQTGQNVDEYKQFEIKLNYKATNRKPTHIVIVASASKYGDFFTGGNGSILWIDDLELKYDY